MTSERITRTIRRGKTTILLLLGIFRKVHLHWGLHYPSPWCTFIRLWQPPFPSRSVVLSRWPPCNNVIPSTCSIFTVLKQQNVYFETETYVAGNSYRRYRPKEETNMDINRKIYHALLIETFWIFVPFSIFNALKEAYFSNKIWSKLAPWRRQRFISS